MVDDFKKWRETISLKLAMHHYLSKKSFQKKIDQNGAQRFFFYSFSCKPQDAALFKLHLSEYEKYLGQKNKVKISLDDCRLTVTYFPKENYQIEYDQYSSEIKEKRTVKLYWENSDEKYIFIPALEHDEVLDRYHIDEGYAYFILRFQGDDLIDLGGIRRQDDQFHYFDADEFRKSNMQEKPRILQAPIIALYTPGLYVKGLRKIGYKAEQMILGESGFGWLLEEQPDYNLETDLVSAGIARARKLEFLIYALRNYDIFHLHSNWSMLGYDYMWTINCDMVFLKKMGKKIVGATWGMCDAALEGTADQYGWLSECEVCTQLRPVRCECSSYSRIIETTQRCSDLRTGNGRACVAYPDILWMDNAIDIDRHSPEIKNEIPKQYLLPKTDQLRIYHSFGNSDERDDIKGTGHIKAAVKRLQAEGYAVEFLFFDKVPHDQLRYYQIQADIVVDQIYCGWYGSTGVECLALGKPVVTYVNPQVEKLLKNMGREIPVISASPQNIYQVLKRLVENESERKEYEKKARRFAENYHDYNVVAKKLGRLYEQIYGS